MVHNSKKEINKIAELKIGEWIIIYLDDETAKILGRPVEIGKIFAWVINKSLYDRLTKSINSIKVTPSIGIETASREKKWFFIKYEHIEKLKVSKGFTYREAKSLEKLWPTKKKGNHEIK